MLLVVSLMSVCYPAVKAGLSFAPPLRFAALRTLIAGIALLIGALLAKRPLWPRRQLTVWIVPFGLVSIALSYGFMFMSPAFTKAGVASILGNTQPLIIVALATIFLSETITRRTVAALTLAFSGVIIMTSPILKQETAPQLTGALLALGTSIFSGVASIVVKKLGPGEDILAWMGWQLLLGALILLVASGLFESDQVITWSTNFLFLLMFLALGGTAAATILWYWCLQKADAGRLSLFLFLVPVMGLFLSTLWHQESMDLPELAGTVLILTGLGIVLRQKNR